MSKEPTISEVMDVIIDFRDFVAQRFDENDRNIHEIRMHLERHDRRFDAHDRRFDEIDRRLDEHDRRFDEHDRRFDEHDRRFDEIDRRLDEHDRRFDEYDRRFDGHEGYFKELKAGIAAILVNQQALERRVHTLESR